MDCDDIAVLDFAKDESPSQTPRRPSLPGSHNVSRQQQQQQQQQQPSVPPSPMMKMRSLSDGGGGSTPSRSGRLSPSPMFLSSASRRTWRDDSSIGSSSTDNTAPMTPRRVPFPQSGLSLQVQAESGSNNNSPMQLTGGQQRLAELRGQQQKQPDQQKQQQQQQQEPQHAQRAAPSTPVSSRSNSLHQLLQQQQQHLHQQQQQQQQQLLQQSQLFHDHPLYLSKPIPLSPKLDPSQIYASPTNILPRRSRGLDFSRAATSLHHSTLAEPSPADLSPTLSSSRAAMNIPGRKAGELGASESSASLWSMMGRSRDAKMYTSSSLGSVHNTMCSDSSSSSDDDDLMDDDPEEAFVTTPQVGKIVHTTPGGGGPGGTPTSNAATGGVTGVTPMVMPWMPSSPAVNSLLSFQHRQRPRKQPKRKVRGPLGLGFSMSGSSSNGTTPNSNNNSNSSNNVSQSPPTIHSRRESISWAANQLHISGSESDENLKPQMDGGEAQSPIGQRGVIRRAVTRRGNLLPKTKGFARIRAALAEESAPIESEFRREAEVVKQVLESDMEPEVHRLPLSMPLSLPTTTTTTTTSATGAPTTSANASPGLFDTMDDLADDFMAVDAGSTGLGLRGPGLLRRRDSTTSSNGGASGGGGGGGGLVFPQGGIFPMTTSTTSMTSMTSMAMKKGKSLSGPSSQPTTTSSQHSQPPQLPSAAELTRRINSKRRRDDDDLDPASFKRRAVSPGMSVHNSPILQSPLQRDIVPSWGGLAGSGGGGGGGTNSPMAALSRPGSNGGVWGGGSAGFVGSLFQEVSTGGGGTNSSASSVSAGPSAAGSSGRPSTKGRVGYQAMVDANESITRLSIE